MPRSNVSTGPLTLFSERAARVAVATAAAFVVVLAGLHVLEPELDPAWRVVSEYELGRYGWLMVLAFVLLAVSAASLFVAVRSQVRTAWGYVGLGHLAIGAAGFLLAAIFTTDPATATHATLHGVLHSAGATLGGFVAGAGLFLTWSLARNRAWAAARRSLLWPAGIAAAGLLASVSMSVLVARSGGRLGPHVLVGWPNRVVILAYAGWMLALAWRVVRLRRGQRVSDVVRAAEPAAPPA